MTSEVDLTDILTPKLLELKADRERAVQKLAGVQAVSGDGDIESEITKRMAMLRRSSELIDSSDPETRRKVIQGLVSKITLNFRQDTQGKRVVNQFVGGVMELSPKNIRDDKTAIELFRTHSLVEPTALDCMCKALTS